MLCPNGGSDDEYPETGAIQIPGKSNALNVEDIGDLNPRISVVAEVFNYIENDSKPPFIRVKQGSHFANLQFNDNIWKNISSKLATKIQKGSILLVTECVHQQIGKEKFH